MAFSGSTLHGNIFAYFFIIATCSSVPIATALMVNLLQTSPYAHNQLEAGNGTCIRTQGFQRLVCPLSRSRSPGALQSQYRDRQLAYRKLSDLYDHASKPFVNFNTSYMYSYGECPADLFSGVLFYYISTPVSLSAESFPSKPSRTFPGLNIHSSIYVVVTTTLIFGVCIILAWVLRVFLLWKNKRPNDEEDQTVEGRPTHLFESCSPRPFTFEELSQATNNFHRDRLLGEGGFGAVYMGTLSNDTKVAVKRVSNTSEQGIKEYKAEITIVSRSNHRHLVQLIGWCHERDGEFLVVYELMSNRSLDVHLFNLEMEPLAWEVRYKIAQSLAKALRYLHEECAQHCVLHRDIKSSNVLLDCNFEAKLGDFGLAKLVDHDKSAEISVLAGTRGYLAPECFITGKVSWQSDVYSYGVVALELATGRRTIDRNAGEDQQVLVKWVQNLYKTGRILEVVDPKLGDDYDELQMEALIVVGLWCVHHEFHERPSMSEIVRVFYAQDPVSDLHQKIPSLIHDLAPQNTDSTYQIETSGDVLAEIEDNAYSPFFIRWHVSIPNLLWYLIDKIWLRP